MSSGGFRMNNYGQAARPRFQLSSYSNRPSTSGQRDNSTNSAVGRAMFGGAGQRFQSPGNPGRASGLFTSYGNNNHRQANGASEPNSFVNGDRPFQPPRRANRPVVADPEIVEIPQASGSGYAEANGHPIQAYPIFGALKKNDTASKKKNEGAMRLPEGAVPITELDVIWTDETPYKGTYLDDKTIVMFVSHLEVVKRSVI